MKKYAANLTVFVMFAGTASAQIQGESGPSWNRYFDTQSFETVAVDAPYSLYEDFFALTIADATGNNGFVFTRLDVAEASATIVTTKDYAQFSCGDVLDDDCDFASQLIFYASRNACMEARVMVDSDMCNFNVGFTDAQYETSDVIAVSAAFSTPTITSTASDCALFVCDHNVESSSKIACIAVKADTDGTWTESDVTYGKGDWHVYRVETNTDGDVDFYLDGAHVYQAAAGITATDPLCAYIAIQNKQAGISNPIYVDYVRAWQGR